MKKRIFKVLNFLALNILFFAIYLNFIHKDINVLPAAASKAATQNFAATAVSKNTVATTKQKPELRTAEN